MKRRTAKRRASRAARWDATSIASELQNALHGLLAFVDVAPLDGARPALRERAAYWVAGELEPASEIDARARLCRAVGAACGRLRDKAGKRVEQTREVLAKVDEIKRETASDFLREHADMLIGGLGLVALELFGGKAKIAKMLEGAGGEDAAKIGAELEVTQDVALCLISSWTVDQLARPPSADVLKRLRVDPVAAASGALMVQRPFRRCERGGCVEFAELGRKLCSECREAGSK